MNQPLAYKNEEFLDSDAARPLRILAEYLEPMQAFQHARIRDTIVFFGSARLAPDGPLGAYYEAARELTFEFHYFFMRKLWFAHLARALIVFPGGFGTLDELTEILTLTQTRKLDRPIPIVLYGSSYWKEVINFGALVKHGMIAPEDLALFRFADDPAVALGLLQAGIEAELDEAVPCLAHSRTAHR